MAVFSEDQETFLLEWLLLNEPAAVGRAVAAMHFNPFELTPRVWATLTDGAVKAVAQGTGWKVVAMMALRQLVPGHGLKEYKEAVEARMDGDKFERLVRVYRRKHNLE